MPRFYETTLSITNLHNLSISTHVNRSRMNYAGTAPRADRTLPGNQMFPETEITTGNKPHRTRRRASIRIHDDEVSV